MKNYYIYYNNGKRKFIIKNKIFKKQYLTPRKKKDNE